MFKIKCTLINKISPKVETLPNLRTKQITRFKLNHCLYFDNTTKTFYKL